MSREDSYEPSPETETEGYTSVDKPQRASAATPSANGETAPLVSAESAVRPTVSVVMPTLNEADGIGECIDRTVAALERLGRTGEIIVSDSSDDRTAEIAREKGAIVVEPDRPGYGYAYRYAFEYARGDYIVLGDADTTYDFEELPRLYRCVADGDADMALGSRLDGDIKPGAMPPLHRYVGNPLLTAFLNVCYDAGVSDAHSGFRVISADALARLDCQSDGMEFASEMIMRACECGLTIDERPITYHTRTGAATLDSFRDGWRHVEFMLSNAPGYLYAIPGLGLLGGGLLLLVAGLFDLPVAGGVPDTYSMIGGAFLTILGVQIGVLGVVSAVGLDPIKSPRDPVTRWIESKFSLKHGVMLSLSLFALGGASAAAITPRRLWSGLASLPDFELVLLVFTAVFLGVQTIFASFLLSACTE